MSKIYARVLCKWHFMPSFGRFWGRLSGLKNAIGLPPCIWTLGAPATILSWSSADSTIESRYCFEFAFSDLTSNSGCSDRSGVKYLE